MFQETRFQQVILKIKTKEKEDQTVINLMINQTGDIFIDDLITKLRDIIQYDVNASIFYYDATRNAYTSLEQQQIHLIPSVAMINQNVLNIRVQEKISDEQLANPVRTQQTRTKRSPERHISQAFQIVQTWRTLYARGTFNQKGQLQKVNLQKAAVILGVPRKSLQDYYLLLRNGLNFGFDFKQNSQKKIGVLRNFLKQKKKNKSEDVQQKQKQKQKMKNQQKYDELILTQIRKQIFGMTQTQYQQELFRVVRNASSDQDQVYDSIQQQ